MFTFYTLSTYSNFKSILELMKIKTYLTKEELEKILSISSKMNRGRTYLPNNFLSISIKLKY